MLHYIITNRQVLSDANGDFIKPDGGETPSENIRFGTFDSDIYNASNDSRRSVKLFADANAPQTKDVMTDAQTQPYSADLATDNTENLTGSKRFFAELFQKLKATEGDILFFVHGYHTDLNGALQSICDLEKVYVNPSSPIRQIVAFTWPAMDKYLRYRDDSKDAELSGYSLARSYLMLIDFFRAIFGPDPQNPYNAPCNNNIHLMAHSMGNRVIESMMVELLSQRTNVTAIFKEVILAASDVDWQVFEDPRAFNKLTEISEMVTVYYNNKDLALFISETTKNAYNRLGKFGFRDYHQVPAHIYSIDCTNVMDEKGIESKLIQHWYYKESANAVKDITQTLTSKRVEDFIGDTRTAMPSIAVQFRLIV
ncbi:MAG: alpha/beta hydrolase [Parafilimonas sp.]